MFVRFEPSQQPSFRVKNEESTEPAAVARQAVGSTNAYHALKPLPVTMELAQRAARLRAMQGRATQRRIARPTVAKHSSCRQTIALRCSCFTTRSAQSRRPADSRRPLARPPDEPTHSGALTGLDPDFTAECTSGCLNTRPTDVARVAPPLCGGCSRWCTSAASVGGMRGSPCLKSGCLMPTTMKPGLTSVLQPETTQSGNAREN